MIVVAKKVIILPEQINQMWKRWNWEVNALKLQERQKG